MVLVSPGVGILVALLAVMLAATMWETGALLETVAEGGNLVSASRVTLYERPLVFRNVSVPRQWPAWKVLRSEEWWREEIRVVRRAATSRGGVFSYAKKDRPLAKAIQGSHSFFAEEPLVVAEMNASEFLQAWKQEDGLKISWSQVLHKWDTMDRIFPLFAPMEALLVNESSPDLHVSPPSIRIWIASKGSRTWGHYDFSHNFFVQLVGVKNFRLSPPNSITSFPWTHPHATKHRVNVRDPAFRGKLYDVTLRPGDVLYIPPAWGHDVVTLESSMSVAVWSTSRDDMAAERLLALGVPRDLRAAFMWLNIVIEGDTGVVRRVLDRYMEDNFSIDSHWLTASCPRPESPIGRIARARQVVPSQLLDEGGRFLRMISGSCRPTLLSNYIEMVGLHFVTKPDLIPTWLTCFLSWSS